MLDFLNYVERNLPRFLEVHQLVLDWKSGLIDFRKPVVERIWKQWGRQRVCLDRILPCEDKEAIYHTHHFPMAMHILSGKYELCTAYKKRKTPLPVLASQVFGEATKENGGVKLQICDTGAYHCLMPVGGPLMVLMVTGQSWDDGPTETDKLTTPQLDIKSAREIGEFFRDYFGVEYENDMDPMG